VDKNDTVWRRAGARGTNVLGTKWQSVTGRLCQISVGQAGVWGVSPRNEVMFRDGTWDLPGEAEGTGWTKVDGLVRSVSVGSEQVWAVSEDGALWSREGLGPGTPMGTHWLRIQDGHDLGWRMVDMLGSSLWAVDSRDCLMVRDNATQDNIDDEKAVHIFHECPNFKLYDLQDKPSSFTVQNGGWVIYEKPNYMGRSLICLDGDCFSNDPNNPKGLKLKQWQTGVGSIRPVTGEDQGLVRVKVALTWDRLERSLETEILDTMETKNSTFSYAQVDWGSVKNVEASVSHSFELKDPVPGLAGKSFSLEEVPKLQIEIQTSEGKIDIGKNFRQELVNRFTFSSGQTAQRHRSVTESLALPPCVPPMFEMKVSTVKYTGTVKIPFVASFSSGNKTWDLNGEYTGKDSTNIKLVFSQISLLESNRKFSKL